MLNQAFLIDSHTWLWWNGEPERLTPKAYDVIANIDVQINNDRG
jgi:PIN domain nuclease of toxin-antitoxin system